MHQRQENFREVIGNLENSMAQHINREFTIKYDANVRQHVVYIEFKIVYKHEAEKIFDAICKLPFDSQYYFSLDFRGFKMGDENVQQLLKLLSGQKTKIASLILDYNDITAASANAISEFISSTDIVSLSLRELKSLRHVGEDTNRHYLSWRNVFDAAENSKTLLELDVEGRPFDVTQLQKTKIALQLKQRDLNSGSKKESSSSNHKSSEGAQKVERSESSSLLKNDNINKSVVKTAKTHQELIANLNESMAPYINGDITNDPQIAKDSFQEAAIVIKFAKGVDIIEAVKALPSDSVYYFALDFSYLNMGDEKAQQLLNCLCEKKIKLVQLNLNCNEISDKSAKSICDFILKKDVMFLSFRGPMLDIAVPSLGKSSCSDIFYAAIHSKALMGLIVSTHEPSSENKRNACEIFKSRRQVLEKKLQEESSSIKLILEAETTEKETAEEELASAKQVIQKLDETHEELSKELEEKSNIIEALREENERLKQELDLIKNPDQEKQSKAASTIQRSFKMFSAHKELSRLKKERKEQVDFIKSKISELVSSGDFALVGELAKCLEKNELAKAVKIIRGDNANDDNLKECQIKKSAPDCPQHPTEERIQELVQCCNSSEDKETIRRWCLLDRHQFTKEPNLFTSTIVLYKPEDLEVCTFKVSKVRAFEFFCEQSSIEMLQTLWGYMGEIPDSEKLKHQMLVLEHFQFGFEGGVSESRKMLDAADRNPEGDCVSFKCAVEGKQVEVLQALWGFAGELPESDAIKRLFLNSVSPDSELEILQTFKAELQKISGEKASSPSFGM